MISGSLPRIFIKVSQMGRVVNKKFVSRLYEFCKVRQTQSHKAFAACVTKRLPAAPRGDTRGAAGTGQPFDTVFTISRIKNRTVSTSLVTGMRSSTPWIILRSAADSAMPEKRYTHGQMPS